MFVCIFGLFVSSGVNIIELLEIIKGIVDNVIVEEIIENVKNVVILGD